MHVSAIIVAAGQGARFGGAERKQFLRLGGVPVLQRSVEAFLESGAVTDLAVALPFEVTQDLPAYLVGQRKPIRIVAGGDRRQDSVANAFGCVADTADLVVVHDAARPLVSQALIARTVGAAARFGAAVAAVAARDTVKRADGAGNVAETLPRDRIYLAQTPQAFRVPVLRDALALHLDATDEAMLAEHAGHQVRLVEGDPRNLKITTPDDLAAAEHLLGVESCAPTLRVGNGYDLHRLVSGRPLILGGVRIPFDKGLLGHSDADAVCHAVTDALLGAAGAGDIGGYFPDNDPAWEGANSLELLRQAAAVVRTRGFAVVNVDVVVIAQRPRLAPHVEAIRTNLADALACDPGQVSVKGKTNEGVDSIGAGESIAAHAVALVSRSR